MRSVKRTCHHLLIEWIHVVTLREGSRGRETAMKTFRVDANNRIVTAEQLTAEGPLDGAEIFGSEEQFAALVSGWPASRLVGIWNELPGLKRVSRFRDRATAVSRIWKA